MAAFECGAISPCLDTLRRGSSLTSRLSFDLSRCGPAAMCWGRACQGHAAVREITQRDHELLRAYASRLRPESRAQLIPEERLEAFLLAGDEEAVERLVAAEGVGLAEERRRYLYRQAGK